VSQANSICQDANEQIQALEPPPDNASVTDVVPFLTQGFAIAREASDKLEALTPPSELQSERDKLVANVQKETTLTEQAIAAAKDNDAAKVQSLSQQLDTFDRQDHQISSSIGLTECAKDVSPQG